MVAYGRSKTANIQFAVEFDRRHKARGVRAAALHPGGIRTELGRHMAADELDALIAQINAQQAANGQPPFAWKTVQQGAATSVWVAFVAPVEKVAGRYSEDCQVSEITDGLISPISPGVRSYALDPARALALWAKSEEMVGERF
jgi:NAD(P)-dependent dehydrogenase (short-subunit alcohol dehydrogenase family)